MKTQGTHSAGAENLRAQDAADYVGISASTLAKLRMAANRNSGPRFAKLGGAVVYRRSDLDDWLQQSLRGGENG